MYNLTTTEKINALLKDKGISKAQFYKDCGISSAAYSLWNQGKTNPSMKNLRTIADYLGVTVASLVDDTKKSAPQDVERSAEDIEFFNLYQSAPEDIRAAVLTILRNGAGK